MQHFKLTCWSLALSFILILAGCTNLGGSAVKGTHINYNTAIQGTMDQQLLLNLVRMRYQETPMFIEISSISSQLSFRVGAAADVDVVPGADTSALSGNIQYTETPTISYTPLQGDDFVKRLLSNIELDKLVLLANSGWSVERISRVCVQRVNDLRNAPRASGPTPATVPEYKEFNALASELRELQLQGALELSHVTFEKQTVPALIFDRQRSSPESIQRVQKLLGITGLQDRPILLNATNDRNGVEIKTRSLLGSLFYLSQAVDVPVPHQQAGKVTLTRTKDGQLYNWSELMQGLLQIRHSQERPEHASVSVRYRDYWFYIDDHDLTSKSTFAFLSQLFALQAGATDSIKPLLTLPLGP